MTLRAVASGGEIPTRKQTRTTNFVRDVNRFPIFFGPQGALFLRLVCVGHVSESNVATADAANGYTVRAALESPGGTVVRFLWGGANDGAVAAGSEETLSDSLLPSAFSLSQFPANAQWWLRYEVEIADGAQMIFVHNAAPSPAITGEGCFQAPTGSASQLMNSGALTTTGGWTTTNSRNRPAAIIGETAIPQVSVGIYGDSISQWSNDGYGNGENGGGGFIRRGIADVSGNVVWGSMSHYGERMARWGTSKKRALLKYYTHVVSNAGTNDLADGTAVATTYGYLDTEIAYARSVGVENWDQVPVMPRTTSASTNWTSDADQTPITGFEVGGTRRDAYNALLASNVGGDIDALINAHTAVQSGTAADKWISTGANDYATNDGIHPSPAAHGLAKTAVTAAVSSYTVDTPVTGTGGGTLGGATVAGTGTAPAAGTGGGTLGGATGSGTGAAPASGSGGGTLGAATVAGVGTGQAVATGEGGGTLGGASVSGTGSAPAAGTGGASLGGATGSGSGTVSEIGEVEAAEPVSLALAKQHLRLDAEDSSEDDLLSAYIGAARLYVENHTSHVLVRREMVQTFSAWDTHLKLHMRPVISVDEVSYTDGDGLEAVYADSVARLSGYPARVHPAAGAWWPSLGAGGEVRVTYTAGYAEGEVPQPLVQAMLLLVGHWYQTREGVNVGNIVSEVPFAVKALCDQYRSVWI